MIKLATGTWDGEWETSESEGAARGSNRNDCDTTGAATAYTIKWHYNKSTLKKAAESLRGTNSERWEREREREKERLLIVLLFFVPFVLALPPQTSKC
jgi:hypothetical protein